MIIVVILIFMISYSLTTGTFTWVYIAETMPPKALGVALFCRWFANGLLMLLQWTLAHVQGIVYKEKSYDETISVYFFFYSGVSICGYFFVLVFVRETQGLSNFKAKDVYTRYTNDLNRSSALSYNTSMISQSSIIN